MTSLKILRGIGCLVLFVSFLAGTLRADEPEYETVVEGLKFPTCVAIQPGTGHVFVADSGASRVVRVVDKKIEPVITGFPMEKFGAEPSYEIGPLGLLFIDKDTLVVGSGGLPAGKDNLSVYKVPATGAEPIKADKIEGDSKSIPASDDAAAEGDFFGLAQSSRGIFVTLNSDDEKVWIGLVTQADGKLKDFSRSISLSEKTKGNAPTAITLSPDGYLAIGQVGELDGEADSLLTFCEPKDGKILKSYETGLRDVSGLAYGPKQGRLFATDFSWNDPAGGQLAKIIAVDDGCKSETILTLESPTSLAFAPNGDLYIALAGDPAAKEPSGKLILVKGLDEAKKEK